MSFEHTVELGDRELVVTFEYYPGRSQTYWEPEEPAEIEIEAVHLAGKNITESLSDEDFNGLEIYLEDHFDDWYDDPYADEPW